MNTHSVLYCLIFGLRMSFGKREPDRQECLSYGLMRIEKAAVLGAGTMGAQIAAHLANARVPTILLDIAPGDLTSEEEAKGLTLESKEVRNRIARAGLEAAKAAKPAALFTPELAGLVTIGNFEDALSKIKDCDLIIEAVVENLEIKRSLYETVEA